MLGAPCINYLTYLLTYPLTLLLALQYVYKVPTDLKPLLIRPYLNDKAKSIVSKLTPDIAGDYSRSKDAFKLSTNTYLERFNSCCKSGVETCVAFASRLK